MLSVSNASIERFPIISLEVMTSSGVIILCRATSSSWSSDLRRHDDSILSIALAWARGHRFPRMPLEEVTVPPCFFPLSLLKEGEDH